MNDCVCISWRKLKNRSDVYERASVITEGLDRELKACLFGRKGALVSLGLILLTLGWREEYHRLPTQSCAESRTSGHGVSLSVPYHQPVFPQSISSLVPFVSVAFFFFSHWQTAMDLITQNSQGRLLHSNSIVPALSWASLLFLFCASSHTAMHMKSKGWNLHTILLWWESHRRNMQSLFFYGNFRRNHWCALYWYNFILTRDKSRVVCLLSFLPC